MAVVRFTETHLSHLSAAGRMSELQHSLIAPTLERALGPAYGRLFAEFEAEGSDVRAWYADAEQAPRRISDMGEPDQQALRRRTAEMIAKVLAHAGSIATESPQQANLARILTAATTFPEDDIWAIGDQPIIVNWGFHRRTQPPGTPRAILALVRATGVAEAQESAHVRKAEAENEAETQAEADAKIVAPKTTPPWRRHDLGWLVAPLLWLVFVGLVGASYRELLPACGLTHRVPLLSGLPALDACLASPVFDRLTEAGARLQTLVEQEELRVAQHDKQCAIDGPAPVIAPDAPRGNVEITLAWHDKADLDLIVECPGGQRLYHGSPGLAACGGQLQRDVNKSGDTLLDDPEEQAAWDSPPDGTFTIRVALYGYNSVRAGTTVPFKVTVKRGDDVQVIDGKIEGAGTIVTVTSTPL